MKKIIYLIFMITVLSFISCENEQNEVNDEAHIAAFRISPNTARIKIGETINLTAYLNDTIIADIKSEKIPDKSVMWQLIGDGTISATKGNQITYTAPTSISDKEIQISIQAFPWMDTRHGRVVNITVYQEVDTSVCFTRDIFPIIYSNCAMAKCHDAITHKEGYILDSYANIVKKGVKPGNPTGSKLYKCLFGDGEEEDVMPPSPMAQLTQEQKDLIYRWILEGAQNKDCSDNPVGGCDTINVTYSKTVVNIVKVNCLGCHSSSQAQGQVNLDSYENVKKYILDGSFMGSIYHSSGFVPMPTANIKLSTCNITQLQKWIDAGYPNN